jgi:hypothetical protein
MVSPEKMAQEGVSLLRGRNVDLPQSWGIPEQSCGLNFNKFVYLETDISRWRIQASFAPSMAQ